MTVTKGSSAGRRDDGAILVFVLVVVILISLIAIPMLGYITSVLRFNNVQADRTQAIEMANGGVWVALSNERDLYDRCPERSGDAPTDLPTSLDGVEATCYLLDDAPLRPATEVPFHVATVAADTQMPVAISSIADVEVYGNPSTEADPGLWLADRTSMPRQENVWIPQLPVQASSLGETRITEMPANSFDPDYDSCRVFFPGTYNAEIVISEPAYFTSGVYSFTQPIVLRDGADVVVGNGTEAGCTNDFEAIGNAEEVPDQLNMSGLGGTFVLGGDARITVDDAGGDDIRFVINQRYVSSEETSVAASSDVAIVSVNGTHAPFFDGETLGQPLFVPGVIDVPASTVHTDGDPMAAASGYLPSTLTVKPSVPDAPTIVAADDFRIGSEGRVTVAWTEPADNGAPVLFYEATDAVTGQTCRTLRPERAGSDVQNTCTLRNIPDGVEAVVSVTATNEYGTSQASSSVTASEVDLSGGSRSPEVPTPTPAPISPTISAYSDGALVEWTAPTPVPGAPIGFSEVRAVNTASGDGVTCRAGWDETQCALLASDGFTAGSTYDITVRSLLVDGDFDRVYLARASRVTVDSSYTYTATSGSVPQPSPTMSTGLRVPPAILDFSTSTGTLLDLRIDGYIAIPQGRLELNAAVPEQVSVSITGGVVAGSIQLDQALVPSELFDIGFDNPTAQKRVRIISDVVGEGIRADAVIQVNRSGSLAINSWVVGSADDTTTPAPDTGGDSGDTGGDDDDDLPYVDPYVGGGADGVDYDSGFVGDPTGASDPHTCTDSSRWSASYWNNTDLAGPADLERCEDAVDADWGDGPGPTGASDFFAARWTKTIDFPNSNEYDFTLGADDGIRLWIDGELVHDNWSTGGYAEETVRLDIAAGAHVVEVEYWENDNDARVSFDFVETLTCSGATPWLGTFYDGQEPGGTVVAERCDAAVDFDWGSGDGPTGRSNDFSARWVRTLDVPATGGYQFLIGADDGVRVFVDGISVYDRWVNQSYSEEALIVSLAAGEREIVVEYYENGGQARVKFEIDIPTKAYVDTIDDDTPIAHWRLDEQPVSGGGGGALTFVDDLETFTGWSQYRNGTIRAETSIVRSGAGSLMKDDRNDPDGGWKSLGGTLSGDFVVEAWAYRPSGWSGGGSDRFGIEDAGHNGYSINVTHSSNRLSIDRRSGGGSSGNVGGNTNLSGLPQDAWYRTVLSRTGDVITGEVFDASGTLLGSVSGTDTSTLTFDRFVVHGGHEYYLDDITVTGTGTAGVPVQPTVAFDRMGLVDGTVSGNPTFGVAPLIAGDPANDSAVDFDAASGDAILIGSAGPLNGESREARTLELWVSIDDATQRAVIYEEGGGTNGMNVYVENGRLFATTWSNSTSWSNTLITEVGISLGTTHHVVVVLDAVGSRSQTLYLDGVEVDSDTKTDANVWNAHSDNGAIGTVNGSTRFPDGATGVSQFFDGRVDEVALYNSALSAGRVAIHHAAGS